MRATAWGDPGSGVRPLALAVAACFSLAVHANPTGPTVVNGSASFKQAGNLLQIVNTPKAIINWQSFSIGAGEITRFLQQSSSSSVLNRVTTQNPSSILGTLQSNGRVFLINPNGIVFGAGSVVNTAGLVASSLNLSNADFLSGRMNFTATPGAGSVINQGSISTASGGNVYLVGLAVTNSGIITSPKGEVVLAAGNSVELVNPGTPNLRVEITAPDNQAVNLGQISAESGRVGIYAGLINQSGKLQANSAVAGENGQIILAATGNAFLNGEIRADGVSGGSISVSAGGIVLQGGTLSATGTTGDGGSVRVAGQDVYQTLSSHIDTSSGSGNGGSIAVSAAGGDGLLLTSGTFAATGERGGDILLLGDRISLMQASVDASGRSQGGTILVGGDYQGANAAVPNARSTSVNAASTLAADARETGNGGKVIVWSDESTQFYGAASARGGAHSGDGGLIEVSGKDSLVFGGTGNAGAALGQPGTLLLDPKNITIGSAPSGVIADPFSAGSGFVTQHAGDQLGSSVVVINDHNFVILAPNYDSGPSADAGAFFMLSPTALLSMAVGSNPGDRIGSGGVALLTNGNAIVRSPEMSGTVGAVTWMNGSNGQFSDGSTGSSIHSGQSLLGLTAGDRVGNGGITALPNGNALIASPDWDRTSPSVLVNAGAVTWMNGATGELVGGALGGLVAAANSVIGASGSDRVGSGGITVLTNNNAVIGSPQWNGTRGAATWINGATGALSTGAAAGAASAANSLVGSNVGDLVGGYSNAALANGNVIINTPSWRNGGAANAGAATWMDGSNGGLFGGAAGGAVSTANSVVGTTAGDQIGLAGVVALPNGNALVLSPNADISSDVDAGAFTWVNGANGRMADGNGPSAVSFFNSHYGAIANDRVGTSATVLANGDVLVSSIHFSNSGPDAGAVTLIRAADGTNVNGSYNERLDAFNSLLGSHANDRIGSGGIVALPSGNAIVLSPEWDSARGAATWIRGSDGTLVDFDPMFPGTFREVASHNSLVGGSNGDRVGSGGATVLTNGNAIIRSPDYTDGVGGVLGAVTWVNGATGQLANGNPMAGGNLFFGSSPGDRIGSGGVVALANGNALVVSPFWSDSSGPTSEVGSIVWINGTNGRTIDGSTTGQIDNSKSTLVGTRANDHVGSGGVFALANGNALVLSPDVDGFVANTGAATVLNGATGFTAVGVGANQVDTINSLTGSQVGDRVGSGGALVLANGNAIVLSPDWNNLDGFPLTPVPGAGAATWINGATGQSNSGFGSSISSSNSVVGIFANDHIGSGGAVAIANSNAVVLSPAWSNDGTTPNAGAATWVNGANGRLANGSGGTIDFGNSVLGATAGDQVGSGGVRALPDGRFLVASPLYDVSGNANSGEVHLVFVPTGVAPGALIYGYRPSENVTITPEAIAGTLSAGTNLVLQANNDIKLAVSSQILVDNPLGNGGALTLQAGRSILLLANSGITTDNGSLTLIANDRTANGVVEAHRDFGPAVINMASGSFIDAGTGTVTINLRDGAPRDPFFTGESGSITLGAITAGQLNVTNAGLTPGSGHILQNGVLNVTGTSSFSATGNVTVDDPSNDFQGAVTLAGRDMRIRDLNTLRLEPTGTNVLELHAEAGDQIILNSGTYDTSAGVAPGVFMGAMDFIAPYVRLVGPGGATLRARQSILISGTVLGPGALTIEHDGYDPSGTTTAGGQVNLNGPLGVGPTFFDPTTSSPIGADGALTSLSITSSDSIILRGAYVAGNASVTTTAAFGTRDISQSGGALTVLGTSSFSATGNVTVDDPSNDFQGAVTLAGRDMRIRDLNTLRLEPTGTNVLELHAEAGDQIILNSGTYDTSAGVAPGVFMGAMDFIAPYVRLVGPGGTTLRARQSILISGTVLGPGALTIEHDGYDPSGTTTAGGQVNLNGPLGVSPSFFDPTTSSPIGADGALASLSITSSDSIILRGAYVAGNASVTTTAAFGTRDISQSGGALTVLGTSSFSATGNVTVDDPSNDFQGAVTLAGRDMRIRDLNTLRLEPTGTNVLELHAEAGDQIILNSGTYDTSAGVAPGVFMGAMDFIAPYVRLVGPGGTTLRARQSILISGTVLGPGALTIEHDGYDPSGTTTAGGQVNLNGPLGVGPTFFDPTTSSPIGADGALASLSITSSDSIILRGAYIAGNASVTTTPAFSTRNIVFLNGNVNAGSLVASATGNIQIGSGTTLSASATGNALVLAASGNFVNDQGAGALSTPAGRWLVYSTSPGGSNENGLTGAAGSAIPRLYNRPYAANGPGTISEPGNHLIYSAQPSLNVTANPAARAYGDANPAFTFLASGFLTDDGVTDTLPQAALTGALATTAVVSSPVGPYPITAGTLASATGYSLNFTGANLTVGGRAITATADNQGKIYGNPDPAFTFTVGGGGLVGSDTLGSVFTGALSRATGETVLGGPYAIGQGTLAANSNYSLTAFTPGQLAITARSIVLQANAGQGKIYGNTDPALTYTLIGGSMVGVDTLSGAPGRVAGENVGSYSIGTGTLANPNYVILFATDNFAITPRPLIVTADDKSRPARVANPPFTAMYSGLAPGDAPAGVGSAPAFATPAGLNSPIGNYPIMPSGITSTNYTITYVDGVLRITTAASDLPQNNQVIYGLDRISDLLDSAAAQESSAAAGCHRVAGNLFDCR